MRSALTTASAVSFAAVLLSASSQTDSLIERNTTVRRVCVQTGVQTYRGPDKKTRILKGDAANPRRLGGGVYVQITGPRANGYVQVKTLKGGVLWIPEAQPESGNPSLCIGQPTVMRVCRTDGTAQDVPVLADFEVESAAPLMAVKQGSLLQLWEYFEDQGRFAFVERDGKVGFIKSETLCHEISAPPGAEATAELGMTVAPAKQSCYQWRRERGASEIRRIVIHNSESTIKSAIAQFQACDPNRPTSAHVGIDRDGKMYRFVEDKYAAFHTGANNGGFNAVSLGVELVASEKPGFTSMASQQERSLLALIRFWSTKYVIGIPDAVLKNSVRSKAYNNLEYWKAPVTIHRLVSADRGTDCPKFVWPDSVDGDQQFFEWRRSRLSWLLIHE